MYPEEYKNDPLLILKRFDFNSNVIRMSSIVKNLS